MPVGTTDNTETVAGLAIIHDALLECTDQPDTRKLIMDTTELEHLALSTVAVEVRDATADEIDQYSAQVVITPPDPDTLRAAELLTNSLDVITQPEICELLRIIGRRLGYDFLPRTKELLTTIIDQVV